MVADAWGFDVERQRLARALFTTRFRIGLVRSAVFAAGVGLFLLLGGSATLRDFAESGSPWLTVFAYFTVLYVALDLAALPFAAHGHALETRFGLARQGWRGWALDALKSTAIGYALTLVAVEGLYWLLRDLPALWWFAAWGAGLVITAVAGVIAPVVLLPLFYKVAPLADPVLAARLRALAERARVPFLGVYVVQASAKTRRANAALAGAGRTRRILLTDTLLATHTPDEIEAVLAHELAHQKHRDFLAGFAESAATSLAGLAVLQAVLPWAASALDLRGIEDPAGMPILMLGAGALSLAFGPIERALSRRREARADRFALAMAGDPPAFASAMVRLHDENLSWAEPPRWLESLLLSHPAGWRRVAAARASPGRALK